MLPFSLRTDKRNQKVVHGEEGGVAPIAHLGLEVWRR